MELLGLGAHWFCHLSHNEECYGEGESRYDSKARSDAEWHNANTGHTVYLSDSESVLWVQTDNGWEVVDR